MMTTTTPPILLKSRMRHTRYFIVALAALVLLGNSILPHETALHETMELPAISW